MKKYIEGIAYVLIAASVGCAHCPSNTQTYDASRLTWTTKACFRVAKFAASESTTPAASVLVLHELPGMTPACINFGQRLAKDGFNVYMPLMFGSPGKSTFVRNSVVTLFKGWRPFRSMRTPTPVDEIRELAAQISAENVNSNLAVVGMCYSGSLPLALLNDSTIRTVVLSQPARPIWAFTEGRKKALGLSGEDIRAATNLVSRGVDVKILGLRFEHDKLSPRGRFDTLSNLFGTNVFIDRTVTAQELSVRCADDHAVLTGSYMDAKGHPTRQRYEGMVELLKERLSNK